MATTTEPRRERDDALEDGPTHAESARTIVTASGTGSLATICTAPAGFPFVSVTLYALDDDANAILALSDLAEHAQNLAQDDRAALMSLEDTTRSVMASGRVTVIGHCRPIAAGPARDDARARYLAAHPNAGYVDFADFKLYRLEVSTARYVGGFGRMSWVKGGDFRAAEPDPIAPHIVEILRHCNDDHPDTVILYCRALGGAPDTTAATMTGVDRHGFVIEATTPAGPRTIRIPFGKQAGTPDDVRQEMLRLAREARERTG